MKSLPNILIVDDHEENLLLLEIITKKIEVNIIKAHSGSEALAKTQDQELALAIIDVLMPEMNGYELASHLNAERSTYKVPVIFLTAVFDNEKDVYKGYYLGAVDYIFKPVNSDILLSKINVFIALFNQRQIIIEEAALLKKTAKELTKVNTALKRSEEKYRNYINNAIDSVFVTDDTGHFLEVNKATCEATGYSEEELLKMSIHDILLEKLLKDHLNKTSKIDFSFKHKDGIKRWWLIGFVKPSEKEYLFFAKDITKRKVAELSMKISEEKYKTILNASPDGILLIDLKGIITEVSEIGIELLGADSREHLIGKNIFRFFPSDEKSTIKEIIEKTLNEGLIQNIGLRIRKNNYFFAGEISSTLIQGSDGTPLSFMIIIRDISQRKKMETKQMHADRMANLGEMASGIAHEINQPLNIISMVMDKILFESAKTETIDFEFLKNKSDKIFENIIRIRNIIDHIKAFSRNHDDYLLTAFNINTSIENATSMITEQFKHLGINLDLQLDKQIPSIIGNTHKFEQIIINLLMNAKDAVLEKKNKQEDYSNLVVEVRSYQDGPFLMIEVIDNGIGINSYNLDNIFLPFYTTKAEGKGTGLGLSICYQIIKEMKGTINIVSERMIGTKITLALTIQKEK